QRDIAVTIVVGLVGEAAGEQRGGAAAGIDAVGAGVPGVRTDPATRAAMVETGAEVAAVVAAATDAQMRAEAFLAAAAAGKHLDHATDRLRAVQARTRAADDLDAL